MATVGPAAFTAGLNIDRGATDWNTPENILTDDNNVASIFGFATNYLTGRGADFSAIGDTDTIDGVTIDFRGRENNTGSINLKVQLQTDDSTLIGSGPKTVVMDDGNSEAAYQAGGAADLWGTGGILATALKASTFGVRLWCTETKTIRIDEVKITVDRTVASAGAETGEIVDGGLVGHSLINHSLVHRSVEKLGSIFVPSRKIIRTRLVPADIALQGA